MNSRNSARTNIFAGILDIHVHNVTGVPGIINVGEHDIFVRFLFGQMDSVSDVILQVGCPNGIMLSARVSVIASNLPILSSTLDKSHS